jgi:hypothetical protein
MPKKINSGYMGGWMGTWVTDWMGAEDVEEAPPTVPIRRQFFRIRRTSRSVWREYFIIEE